jgi:hypothetical protein
VTLRRSLGAGIGRSRLGRSQVRSDNSEAPRERRHATSRRRSEGTRSVIEMRKSVVVTMLPAGPFVTEDELVA